MLNIEKLYLKDFRNYEKEEINFYPGINILFGENAQGKTNILESIYLIAMGKSYRSRRYNEMIKWDKDMCKVYLEYTKSDIKANIEFFIKRNQKKQIKINGVNIEKIGDILGKLNIVMFSPEHLKIVKEGPSERRKFIDAILSQVKPKYYYNLIQYLKVLGQRNFLLSNCENKKEIDKTLDIWDNQLVEYGAKIIKDRYTFIKSIGKTSGEINNQLSGDKEKLLLTYKPSLNVHDYTMEGIIDVYSNTLNNGRKTDIKRGNSNWGPHRDELIFSIKGKELRNFGSQGQQRSALLSLKLAETIFIKEETGQMPVLLLDDVFSELDKKRCNYLLEYIKNIQVILTTTDLANIDFLNLDNSHYFSVKNAFVKEEYMVK